MKKHIFGMLMICAAALASCGKKVPQGKLVYTLSYDLPDNIRQFADHLPKEAVVYFKGDSAVVVQKMGDESTTVITHQPTKFMDVLFKSPKQSYQVNYSKQDQEEDRSHMPIFEAVKGPQTKTMNGVAAQQYTLSDKMTTENQEAWFTTAIKAPQSYLSKMLDPVLGVPLVFSYNQNGMITHVKIKEINTDEDVPAGVFTVPAGYQKLAPKDLQMSGEE
ncbi:hypothetical protein C8P68_102341 [Mucilaginibacter yixingensis]|uniref:DUF4412 domain-containing protein n=1 Tax=Mucilaginibacter yixingensis TaxID=1295612 RepID=A0A2T5JCL7_9SPHI|nr:hypothetical protein [Mucilaginibacter yixingensis]PTQ99517.1 hypothetical protein C8P68_102341 [Mucilaginibacter yixingensis]